MRWTDVVGAADEDVDVGGEGLASSAESTRPTSSGAGGSSDACVFEAGTACGVWEAPPRCVLTRRRWTVDGVASPVRACRSLMGAGPSSARMSCMSVLCMSVLCMPRSLMGSGPLRARMSNASIDERSRPRH